MKMNAHIFNKDRKWLSNTHNFKYLKNLFGKMNSKENIKKLIDPCFAREYLVHDFMTDWEGNYVRTDAGFRQMQYGTVSNYPDGWTTAIREWGDTDYTSYNNSTIRTNYSHRGDDDDISIDYIERLERRLQQTEGWIRRERGVGRIEPNTIHRIIGARLISQSNMIIRVKREPERIPEGYGGVSVPIFELEFDEHFFPAVTGKLREEEFNFDIREIVIGGRVIIRIE